MLNLYNIYLYYIQYSNMNKIVKPLLGFLFLVGIFLVLRHLYRRGYLHLEHIKKIIPKSHSPEDKENKEKDSENKEQPDEEKEKTIYERWFAIENHMHDYLIGEKIM